MALRTLLSQGNTVFRHRLCESGVLGFLVGDGRSNNRRHGWWRDSVSYFATRTGATGVARLTFPRYPKAPYTVHSIFQAIIKDPEENAEIVKMTQFAVNEHNAREGCLDNLQFVGVPKAELGFYAGIAKYYISLHAIDHGSDGLTKCYMASLSQRGTSGLTLSDFYLIQPDCGSDRPTPNDYLMACRIKGGWRMVCLCGDILIIIGGKVLLISDAMKDALCCFELIVVK